jgi:hypothetical protein
VRVCGCACVRVGVRVCACVREGQAAPSTHLAIKICQGHLGVLTGQLKPPVSARQDAMVTTTVARAFTEQNREQTHSTHLFPSTHTHTHTHTHTLIPFSRAAPSHFPPPLPSSLHTRTHTQPFTHLRNQFLRMCPCFCKNPCRTTPLPASLLNAGIETHTAVRAGPLWCAHA